MPEARSSKAVLYALWANAAMLALLALALFNRSGGDINLAQKAYGQAPGIAGGAGVYIMPGQLAERTWGCFLLDVDSQTLTAYEYKPGPPSRLVLAAGRTYKQDRKLTNFNTTPPPAEIQQIIEREQKALRGPVGGAPEKTPGTQ